MRNIILNLAISLDGYIEGPNGEYDWCFTDQDYGMTDFLAGTDALLLGRKSFEMLENYDPNAYPGKTMYVFSRTLTQVAPGKVLVQESAEERVREIQQQPGQNIWLFGGASLTSTLLKAGLVNELLLSVHPILLGQGKPLFQDLQDRYHLQLLHSQTYASGLVQLHYRLLV